MASRSAKLLPDEGPAKPGLGQDTAQTLERRLEEAEDLLEIIRGTSYAATEKESKFLEDMAREVENWGAGHYAFVSGKQVMWLRDIKEKAIRS